MFIVHFLLLLVPLVLFHELGHFVVARLMGVRVLSFSIGFGPVIAAWQRGHTEYAVRALPLGGFVRMLGEDPTADPDPTAVPEPDAFNAKPVWRRALIVAAGPIANFILPVVILLVGSLMMDGQIISSRLGTVLPGGPAAEAGLRPGDQVVAVEGEEVGHFEDLRRTISARPGLPTRVEYLRHGERSSLTLTPAVRRQVRLAQLGVVEEVGRIQVLPDAQASIVRVVPGSAAWRAGLRSGDRIVAVDTVPTPRWYDVDAALVASAAAGRGSATLGVRRLIRRAPLAEDALNAAFEAPHAEPVEHLRLSLAQFVSVEGAGISGAQTLVGPVLSGSPAATGAGLRSGDEILAVDGAPADSFLALLDLLHKAYDDVLASQANQGLDSEALLPLLRDALVRPHLLAVRHTLEADEIAWLRAAFGGMDPAATAPPDWLPSPGPAWAAAGYVDREASLSLGVELGASGRPRLQFGASGLQRYEPSERIPNPDRLLYAWQQSRDQMLEAMQVTLLTVAGLFRGRVPVKEVGGPIFMAQLAARTEDLGWGYFFKLMVWLSINLAILNLLPIPLVDGGHLLFLAIEAVKREPVSLRTRMIASYVGMSFIGLLFVVVMKNDVQRLIESLTQ